MVPGIVLTIFVRQRLAQPGHIASALADLVQAVGLHGVFLADVDIVLDGVSHVAEACRDDRRRRRSGRLVGVAGLFLGQDADEFAHDKGVGALVIDLVPEHAVDGSAAGEGHAVVQAQLAQGFGRRGRRGADIESARQAFKYVGEFLLVRRGRRIVFALAVVFRRGHQAAAVAADISVHLVDSHGIPGVSVVRPRTGPQREHRAARHAIDDFRVLARVLAHIHALLAGDGDIRRIAGISAGQDQHLCIHITGLARVDGFTPVRACFQNKQFGAVGDGFQTVRAVGSFLEQRQRTTGNVHSRHQTGADQVAGTGHCSTLGRRSGSGGRDQAFLEYIAFPGIIEDLGPFAAVLNDRYCRTVGQERQYSRVLGLVGAQGDGFTVGGIYSRRYACLRCGRGAGAPGEQHGKRIRFLVRLRLRPVEIRCHFLRRGAADVRVGNIAAFAVILRHEPAVRVPGHLQHRAVGQHRQDVAGGLRSRAEIDAADRSRHPAADVGEHGFSFFGLLQRISGDGPLSALVQPDRRLFQRQWPEAVAEDITRISAFRSAGHTALHPVPQIALDSGRTLNGHDPAFRQQFPVAGGFAGILPELDLVFGHTAENLSLFGNGGRHRRAEHQERQQQSHKTPSGQSVGRTHGTAPRLQYTVKARP